MENRGNTVSNVRGRKKGRGASAKLEKQRKKEELRAKMLEARAKANAEYLIIKTDDERPATVSHRVARPVLTTVEKIEKNLKAISLGSIVRQAKTTSAGYDNAITAYKDLCAQNVETEKLIKECRAPRGSDDAVKEEFKAKRAELKKAQKEIMRKADIAYEKAIALERSADEYSYIEALLSNEPEKNYRKEDRINEKKIDLTKEEELELVERYLNGGKKKKKTEEVIQEEFDVVQEEVKTLKVLGYEKPKAPEAKAKEAPASAEVPVKKAEAKPAPAVQQKDEEKKAAPAPKAAKDTKCPCRKRGLGLLFALAAIVIILLVSLVKCGKEDDVDPAPVVVETPADISVADDETAKAAEAEALLKAEEEARIKAEAEAKAKAEEEAKAKAEEEARIKAEAEAKAAAEEEARIKAEQEARIKAEEEAKAKAEMISPYWDIYGEIAYAGYSFDLEIGRGSTKVFFDEKSISESDVEMFIGQVAGKYSSYLDGVVYEIEDGVLFVDYPFIISEEDQLFIFDTLNSEAVGLIKSFQIVEEEEIEVIEEVQAIVEPEEAVEFNLELEPYVATESGEVVVEEKEKKLTITSYPMNSTGNVINVSDWTKSSEPEEKTEKKLTITSYTIYPTGEVSESKKSSDQAEKTEKKLTITSYPINSTGNVINASDWAKSVEPEEKTEKKLTITSYTIYPKSEAFIAEPTKGVEKKLETETVALEEVVAIDPNFYDTISLYGYSADFRIGPEDATVKYPSNIIYPEDLENFAAFAFPKYSEFVDGVDFAFSKDRIDIDYPYTLTEDGQKIVFDTVKNEILAYVDYYLAKAVEEAVAEPETVAEPEVVAIAPEVVEEPEEAVIAAEVIEEPEVVAEVPAEEEKAEEAVVPAVEEEIVVAKAESEEPKSEETAAPIEEAVAPPTVSLSFDVVIDVDRYEPSFNMLFTGGVATDVSLAPEFVLDGTYPRVGLAMEFQNILSSSWFGIGLRSDLSAILIPRDKNWANMPTSFNELFAGNIYVDASVDAKLMAYFGNDVFDLYLGGGLGYSVFYPQLGASAADYGHSLGAVGLFESAWFASGNAGLRFMLNDTLSIGAEVNYRYLIPAEKHSASADIVFGISL